MFRPGGFQNFGPFCPPPCICMRAPAPVHHLVRIRRYQRGSVSSRLAVLGRAEPLCAPSSSPSASNLLSLFCSGVLVKERAIKMDGAPYARPPARPLILSAGSGWPNRRLPSLREDSRALQLLSLPPPRQEQQ